MDFQTTMTWCILSTDPAFVAAMWTLLGVVGQDVYTATTWDEYERLQQEGAVFEGLVLDPVDRVV